MKFKLLDKNRDKYVVVFCVREGNSFNCIKSVYIKPNQNRIKYDKENEFLIDIENHSYRRANVRFYYIDINAQQIYFEQLKDSDFITSRITKRIITDQIIEQLATATTTPIKQTYDYKALLIGAIIGALVGFIIKIFVPLPI